MNTAQQAVLALLVFGSVIGWLVWHQWDVARYPLIACGVCRGSGKRTAHRIVWRGWFPRLALVGGPCTGCQGHPWSERRGGW